MQIMIDPHVTMADLVEAKKALYAAGLLVETVAPSYYLIKHAPEQHAATSDHLDSVIAAARSNGGDTT